MNAQARITQLVLGSLCAYVGLYLLLMRQVPSVDDAGNVAYVSSFRFAPRVRLNGSQAIYFGRANFLNELFYPLDWAYWNAVDSAHWKQFQLWKVSNPEETVYFEKQGAGK